MAENYKALTRKFRPASFDDIVSQEHVCDTLKNAIAKNRLAHAYLFSGPRGVGKTTMARVLARAINNVDASIDGEHLNQTLNIVEIDAASNNSVEDARHLREAVRIPPQNGDYKVFIIDEVHMLSKAAFNALLKTLEEPPSYAIFIFATTEPHKVLPTILSRVQRFDFKRISVNEIVQRLRHICAEEGIGIDEESLHLIAKKADGALRDALSIMDQAIALCGVEIEYQSLLRALNVVGQDRYFALLDFINQHQANKALLLIDEILQEGFDMQEFLVGLTEFFRNMYMALSPENIHLIEATEETKTKYRNIVSSYSDDDILRLLHITSETQYKIKDAHQPRIQFELGIIKLCKMSKASSIQSLLSELESLKKKGLKLPLPETQTDEKKNSSTSVESRPKSNAPSPTVQPNNAAQVHEPKTEPTKEIKTKVEVHNPPPTQAETQSKPAQSTPQPAANLNLPKPLLGNGALGGSAAMNDRPPVPPQHLYDQEIPHPGGYQNNTGGRQQVPSKLPPLLFADIREKWDHFLENSKGKSPESLRLILQNLILEDYRDKCIHLSAGDPFMLQTIKKNEKVIEDLLYNYFKRIIHIKCKLGQVQTNENMYKDPYQQFVELQKKEPKLRTIVELFGAELEF